MIIASERNRLHILLLQDKVVVGNAGDSRAVLCHNGVAVELSVDHKPEDDIGLFLLSYSVKNKKEIKVLFISYSFIRNELFNNVAYMDCLTSEIFFLISRKEAN